MIYLLYSQSQKAYHREYNLDGMVADNLAQLEHGVPADYVVIGYALEGENADSKFDLIREKLGRP